MASREGRYSLISYLILSDSTPSPRRNHLLNGCGIVLVVEELWQDLIIYFRPSGTFAARRGRVSSHWHLPFTRNTNGRTALVMGVIRALCEQ